MTFGIVFWIIMLLWLLWSLPMNQWGAGYPWASNVMLFILFLLLGWRVFGQPVHG